MEVANTDALTPGAPTIANVTRAPGFTWMAAPASVSDFVAGLLQMNNRNSIVGLQHMCCNHNMYVNESAKRSKNIIYKSLNTVT